tara:strand:+ start:4915 stop:6816 length:1902 start_codon:yes stop_codon:yes gene_type:complete
MRKQDLIIKDEIDLITMVSVVLDNFNLLVSILFSSLFVVFIYYLSASNVYVSESLLEIKQEKTSFLPQSLSQGLPSPNDLEAEVEIYKSNSTLQDSLELIKSTNTYDNRDLPESVSAIRRNLNVFSDNKSLLSISFKSTNRELSSDLLDRFNAEYIKDRKNFQKESSAAGRDFIRKEIPKIKVLLKNAEESLNNFKVSTNTSDYIFDTKTTNVKLERLKNRINEIEFKELELKEFYKESHPIYLTLTKQKNLINSQILEIEDDLPLVPSTQRQLENFKREVEIYSNVLRELSSQEISLGMKEASSISNVRIINSASKGVKISPSILIFVISFALTFFAYLFLLFRHFLGDRITNFDALADYVGKEKIIGEFPLISKSKNSKELNKFNIADELMNKFVYEISHNLEKEQRSIAILGSRKDVGKTEISRRLFDKLRTKYKTCLIDLDYRKKGLSKDLSLDTSYKSFLDFRDNSKDQPFENDSIVIPSFNVEDPADFFASELFASEIEELKKEFDYVICDTSPWKLFVDSKIISKNFSIHLYIVCNQITTFQDLDLFMADFPDQDSLKFFYNKFNLYFNFLGYKYQYPYYSKNFYYEYSGYGSISKGKLNIYLEKLYQFVKKFFLKIKQNIMGFLK